MGIPSNPRDSTGKAPNLRFGGLSDRREGAYNFGLAVTEKGFFSFAAEKAGGRKRSLDAAKLMKPCIELNLD
jgi:hypothetical protein